MEKAKTTLIFTIEKQENGVVNIKTEISGQGFHIYEIVGLLQVECVNLAIQSRERAEQVLDVSEDDTVFENTRESDK